eukprot:932983-Pyramimonas_sp.AAC.1
MAPAAPSCMVLSRHAGWAQYSLSGMQAAWLPALIHPCMDICMLSWVLPECAGLPAKVAPLGGSQPSG